jgi:hypothetical protein
MHNWYQKCRAEIEKRYGDDADLFCDLLAATSPRKHVKSNWKLAVRIYEKYKKDGPAFCAEPETQPGVMPCHYKNIFRALNGEPLSGRKVRAFAANLRGDLDQVTIDVWTARFFGFEKITDKVYTRCVQVIRATAGYTGQKPAEVQAEIWCEAMRAAGRKPKSFISAMDFQLKLWEE